MMSLVSQACNNLLVIKWKGQRDLGGPCLPFISFRCINTSSVLYFHYTV